jgi:hypothetical protein
MVCKAEDVPGRAKDVLGFHEFMDIVGQMVACRSVGVERRPIDRMIVSCDEIQLRGGKERRRNNSRIPARQAFSLFI